ncbi:hypothetical protein [Micromonospora sp. WMMD1155]|uniref:hypothetical protein n=1 Tax=Micromonospora sp. WMMD1155 TaxID=3016094 RepID=UPI00249C4F44|nr:hypothetical protein [Micromonospora sp. WMMD1155]WFE49768.1 hypothetical protein O7617_05285 [Micromonospora sp. WMMD1155]
MSRWARRRGEASEPVGATAWRRERAARLGRWVRERSAGAALRAERRQGKVTV